jgi:hypothetical protein
MMATDTTCRLLSLPAELRLRIYDDVLTTSFVVGFFGVEVKQVVALLCTCRQINNEATPQYIVRMSNEVATLEKQEEILGGIRNLIAYARALSPLDPRLELKFVLSKRTGNGRLWLDLPQAGKDVEEALRTAEAAWSSYDSGRKDNVAAIVWRVLETAIVKYKHHLSLEDAGSGLRRIRLGAMG